MITRQCFWGKISQQAKGQIPEGGMHLYIINRCFNEEFENEVLDWLSPDKVTCFRSKDYLSHVARKPARSDTNRAVQPLKLARG